MSKVRVVAALVRGAAAIGRGVPIVAPSVAMHTSHAVSNDKPNNAQDLFDLLAITKPVKVKKTEVPFWMSESLKVKGLPSNKGKIVRKDEEFDQATNYLVTILNSIGTEEAKDIAVEFIKWRKECNEKPLPSVGRTAALFDSLRDVLTRSTEECQDREVSTEAIEFNSQFGLASLNTLSKKLNMAPKLPLTQAQMNVIAKAEESTLIISQIFKNRKQSTDSKEVFDKFRQLYEACVNMGEGRDAKLAPPTVKQTAEILTNVDQYFASNPEMQTSWQLKSNLSALADQIGIGEAYQKALDKSGQLDQGPDSPIQIGVKEGLKR